MPLTRDEASSTLRDIAKAERRSSSAYGYKSAAPYLILWGVIWAFGYAANDFFPAYGGQSWGVLLGFFYALFTVMAPVSDRQVGTFFPLFFGTLYLLMGIWMGLRLVIAGATIVALSMIAFYFVHDHFGLWMAALSGGTLILSGLWLRTV